MRDKKKYYDCLEHFISVIGDLFPTDAHFGTYEDSGLWIINIDWPIGGTDEEPRLSRFFRVKLARAAIEDYLESHQSTRPERDARLRSAIATGLENYNSAPTGESDQKAFEVLIPNGYLNAPV